MDPRVSSLLDDLSRYADVDLARSSECVLHTKWIATADDEHIHRLLAELQQRLPLSEERIEEKLLESVFAELARRAADAPWQASDSRRDVAVCKQVVALYRKLGSRSSSRHHLLSVLVHRATSEDLSSFADLVVSDPPPSAVTAAAPFLTLLHAERIDVSALFPRILAGIQHLQVAAPILDLANYLTRQQLVRQHPAAQRKGELINLLGTLVGQLGHLEESPPRSPETWDRVRNKVNDGVALAVSLCDALALIGDPAAVGKLNQALGLEHRRVRTEAAAALARFGEQKGEQELVKLAAEPVARLRVLAYSDELEITDQIEDRYKTAEARAEAELACFLSEPTQFGMPPSQMELIDECNQNWPGFDDPVDCFLFRYTYVLSSGSYSNIGVAGPLVHTFTADIADLPSADIYAAFVGWQAEHEEIFEIDIRHLESSQHSHAQYREQVLHDAGYEDIRQEYLGLFFGEEVLLATACRSGVPGCAVVDEDNIDWYPSGDRSRPITTDLAYAIYKGRKLLQRFNG